MDEVGVKSMPSLDMAEVPLPRLALVEFEDVDEAEMKDDDEDEFMR